MNGREMRLGDGLRKLTERLGGRGGSAGMRVAGAWAEVVGEHVARRTHVRGLRKGELLVAVDSSAWANELSMMTEELKDRVNEALGQESVRSVRLTVSKEVAATRQEAAAREDAARGYAAARADLRPLSEAELEEIRRVSGAIEDTELREAVERAMTKERQWLGARSGSAEKPQAEGEETGP